mmetsp:Transcript_91687/g.256204  ORF Transcript_91687/g.256204 Transcript_91687/m.256204 type:complete len:237 (-) Transcript_91687:129-839(-)
MSGTTDTHPRTHLIQRSSAATAPRGTCPARPSATVQLYMCARAKRFQRAPALTDLREEPRIATKTIGRVARNRCRRREDTLPNLHRQVAHLQRRPSIAHFAGVVVHRGSHHFEQSPAARNRHALRNLAWGVSCSNGARAGGRLSRGLIRNGRHALAKGHRRLHVAARCSVRSCGLIRSVGRALAEVFKGHRLLHIAARCSIRSLGCGNIRSVGRAHAKVFRGHRPPHLASRCSIRN